MVELFDAKGPKSQNEFADEGMAYIVEVDTMGEETFQVGIHRRAIGSRNNCCTLYDFEISSRESKSKLGVCCVYARVGKAQ